MITAMWLLQMDELTRQMREEDEMLDYEDGEIIDYHPSDDELLEREDFDLKGPRCPDSEKEKPESMEEDQPSPAEKEKLNELSKVLYEGFEITEEKAEVENQGGSSGMVPTSSEPSAQEPKVIPEKPKKPKKKRIYNQDFPRIKTAGRKRIRRGTNYAGDPSLKVVQYTSTQDIETVHRDEDDKIEPEEDLRNFIGQRCITPEPDEDEFDNLYIEVVEEESEDERRPWKKAKDKKKRAAVLESEAQGGLKGAEGKPTTEIQPPPVVRYKDIYFTSSSKKLGLEICRLQWELNDRFHKFNDLQKTIDNRVLEKTPIQEFVQRIKDEKFHGKNLHGFRDIGSKVKNNEEAMERIKIVQEFVEEVERTGIISFNTEGHRSASGKIMMTVGNFKGTVLFINDCLKFPASIRNIFSDFGITKIGVGIGSDLAELYAQGIKIRNWVDIGCVRLSLYQPAQADPNPWTPEQDVTKELKEYKLRKKKKSGFGGGASNIEQRTVILEEDRLMKFSLSSLVFDLKQCGLLPDSYRRTPYHPWWNGEKYFKVGEYPPPMEPHIVENARMPFAYLICVARHFAQDRGYDILVEPIMPIIHEILDLVRGRDPEQFQRAIDRDVDYWMSRPVHPCRNMILQFPSDCVEMNIARKAFSDHSEEYFPDEVLKTNVAIAVKRFKEGGLDIPEIKCAQERKGFVDDIGRCRNCAKRGHVIEDCEEVFEDCNYDHDGGEFTKHSILTCPVLHHFCEMCLTVGHLPTVHYHPDHRKPQIELRRRFFENMVKGAWTSIPFLTHDTEMIKKTSNKHWRFSYDGCNFRKAIITRVALKINGVKSLGVREESDLRNEENTWQHEEEIRRGEYRTRIEASYLSEMTPLDRKFYDKERSRLAKERREGLLKIREAYKARKLRR